MSVPPQTGASPPTTADGGSPSGCVHCGLPLTKRGARGECLRCALRLGWMEEEGDAQPSDEETTKGGRRYGHFEVVLGYDGLPVELGSGAMGTTYRAQDMTLRADVALKVIDGNVASHPAARARFLREARAAARLHHPNVAAVFHYGEQDGECFYAMELVEGETLTEHVRRSGPLGAEQALEIGVQVARALAAAEAIGVVHRDLKPSNLMLTGAPAVSLRAPLPDGAQNAAPLHVKVIDWGLAKAFGTGDELLGADHTRDAFVGTPAFASPEQFARAAERRIDVRSDIYSLGVTLWFLLCGKVPFVGDTLDAVHARQKVLPVEHLKVAKVPGCLAKTLRSMLAFDPADRPQSARELLDVLGQCQRRCTDIRPAAVRRRRSRRLGAVLAVVALLLVGGALARWKTTRHRPPAPPGIKPSLAVLPFENLSREPSDAFFTVGTQDEIANDLAHVAALNVVGTESTRSYPPGVRDLSKIGQELGVRYLLEGSVRRQDDRVRIEVRLWDGRDPSRPWSETYTRRLNEVFAAQGEITRAVAAQVRATLSAAEKAAIDRPPTSDLAAYDLYLRAVDDEQTFQSAEDRYRYGLETTVPLLEQSVQRDPQFALAYAKLAHAYTELVPFETDNGQPEQAQRHRAAGAAALAKAVRLRPDAGEVHLAQALNFYEIDQNYEQAVQELDLARSTLPNNAVLEGLAGDIARGQNHWPEAVRSLERAVFLAPRNYERRFVLADTYRCLRRFEDSDRQTARIVADLPADKTLAFRMYRAIGRLEQSADLDPLRETVAATGSSDDARKLVTLKARLVIALYSHDAAGATALLADIPAAGLVWGSNRLPKGWFEALAARLRHDETATREALLRARAEEERVLLTDPTNGVVLSLLATIDAGLGRREQAVEEGKHACELTPVEQSATDAPVVASQLAVVYAWTGQPERACETLEPWLNRPAGITLVRQPMYGDLKLNPVWDPLRGHERFEALVARLAAEERPAPTVEPTTKP